MPPLCRTPVSDNVCPGCWGRFRGDAACTKCDWHDLCQTTSEKLAVRKTLREAIQACPVRKELAVQLDPGELAIYAQTQFVKVGGKRYRTWAVQRPYLAAMTTVIRACTSVGWDARMYIRAQVKTYGWVAAQRGYQMQAGAFCGANADQRFKKWALKNGYLAGDQRAEDVTARARAATSAFANAFIVQGMSIAESVATARSFVPNWTVAEVPAPVRLAALADAVAAFDSTLPDRLLVPDGPWTWKAAREFIWSLLT
jgi:hypothetical protein